VVLEASVANLAKSEIFLSLTSEDLTRLLRYGYTILPHMHLIPDLEAPNYI
jgi:hypothetical protein